MKFARLLIFALVMPAWADESGLNRPDRPAPGLTVNRELMLQMLENSKKHHPRIPLPEPTAKDRENATKSQLGLVNNGLMRRNYLPESWSTAAFPGRSAQTGLVDYAFKTELFWIISRLNNCAYCLGHQEAKLATAGLTEAQIAALDGDWADADKATRAARQLAVLKTKSPHEPVPATIWHDLRTKFNDDQIGEILLTIGNYNAMNRWTGPLNIPQEEHRNYTSGLGNSAKNKSSTLLGDSGRAPWANRRLPDFGTFLKTVQSPATWPVLPIVAANQATNQPAWRVLMDKQGTLGQARLKSWQGAIAPVESADVAVNAKLRGQILWLAARLDNAPHAAAEARAMLHGMGVSDDELKSLESAESAGRDEKTDAVLRLVRLVTLNPAWVGDDDIEAVRKHFGDRGTAQIVEMACIGAAVNRLQP
ncbi:MAG: carboxymuconolactone decarboxylase family protein [bacterium]